MELSPGQQRLLFVVVVIVLVGLGFFLIEGRSHGTTAASSTTTPTPSASATAAASSAAATATPPATEPAATEPAATQPATTAGGANIYQWLPFTQPDLTAAAKTTLAFAKDYVTWNSKESKAAYGATMAGLVTTQEDTTLENDFATAARAAGNAVSTGSGSIDSISSFGPNPASITFSVTLTQQVVPAQGTSASPSQYDITVVSTGAGWQVNNIQLFSVGNQ